MVKQAKLIRILAIAPYAGMRRLLEDAKAARAAEIELTICVGDWEEGLRLAREMMAHQEFDVILSRGGTAKLLRERLGLLTEPAEQVRAEARLERERMLTRLREHGLLGDDPSEREIVEALHRYVVRTPSALVGVALVDGVGERRAQNQPGTDQEYPNWKIPLADGSGSPVLIEDLPDNVRLASLLAAVRDEMTR